jgi:hypothetical protein
MHPESARRDWRARQRAPATARSARAWDERFRRSDAGGRKIGWRADAQAEGDPSRKHFFQSRGGHGDAHRMQRVGAQAISATLMCAWR